ncbi:MAG: TlpA disulfide reductase family protein [Methylococcales bacterium]|nr:TlpA disulfide reductase family protein [Methylococcales bacterium]
MKTAIVLFVALMAIGAGVMFRGHTPSVSGQTNPDTLPDFSLPDSKEALHPISEWRGKLLVINFWATWCGPCRKEIPEFIALQQQYAAKGLQFVGIAIDDAEPVEKFVAAMKINYPILISGLNGMALAQQLGNTVDAVPYTVIVNPQGQIIHRQAGEFSKDKIMAVIGPLLK